MPTTLDSREHRYRVNGVADHLGGVASTGRQDCSRP